MSLLKPETDIQISCIFLALLQNASMRQDQISEQNDDHTVPQEDSAQDSHQNNMLHVAENDTRESDIQVDNYQGHRIYIIANNTGSEMHDSEEPVEPEFPLRRVHPIAGNLDAEPRDPEDLIPENPFGLGSDSDMILDSDDEGEYQGDQLQNGHYEQEEYPELDEADYRMVNLHVPTGTAGVMFTMYHKVMRAD